MSWQKKGSNKQAFVWRDRNVTVGENLKSRKEIWWHRGEGQEVGDVGWKCLSTKGVPTTETLWLFLVRTR